MVQRIKVQSGQIVYESADSAYDINFDVKGVLGVTTSLNLGSSVSDGLITTPSGTSLYISPDGGDLTLNTVGGGATFSILSDAALFITAPEVILNGSVWPSGSGVSEQVLATDGAGTLYWSDGGTGTSSVTIDINATGSDYSTATPITSNFNVVSTTDIGGGVRLPSGSIGMTLFVFNQSSDDIFVYPDQLLSQIDVYGFSTGYLLEAGYRVSFVAVSSSQWYTLGVPFIPAP